MPRRAFFNRYSPPGIDSPRARANAVWLLTNMRSLDGLTIETFAHAQRLKTATAARLIAEEVKRRNNPEGESEWRT
jgi:hypothetical protein